MARCRYGAYLGERDAVIMQALNSMRRIECCRLLPCHMHERKRAEICLFWRHHTISLQRHSC